MPNVHLIKKCVVIGCDRKGRNFNQILTDVNITSRKGLWELCAKVYGLDTNHYDKREFIFNIMDDAGAYDYSFDMVGDGNFGLVIVEGERPPYSIKKLQKMVGQEPAATTGAISLRTRVNKLIELKNELIQFKHDRENRSKFNQSELDQINLDIIRIISEYITGIIARSMQNTSNKEMDLLFSKVKNLLKGWYPNGMEKSSFYGTEPLLK
jgi:hypothetical protein